jgi:hypothetical protein
MIHSGNVLLQSDRRRLVLLDDYSIIVDSMIVSTDVCISMGMSVEFPCHLVNVGEQISRLGDYDQSSPEERVLLSDQPSPHEYRREDALLIWKVSYSTRKDLDRGRMKSYDGTLKFWSSNGWIVLLNAKDKPIDVQVLRVDPCYKSGSKVRFPHHVVRINSSIVTGVMDCHMDHQKGPIDILADKPVMKDYSAAEVLTAASDSPMAVVSEPQVPGPSFAMHTAITLGLYFKAGENFAKEVLRRFSSTVHPLNGKTFSLWLSLLGEQLSE